MLRRSFGTYLKLDVLGASHAPELAFRLANFPRGVRIDADALGAFMERRAPGRDRYSTARRESDAIEFRSGVIGATAGGRAPGAKAGDLRKFVTIEETARGRAPKSPAGAARRLVTTGEPIVGAIANRDMRPGDYGVDRTIPRPGHADFGQWIETGRIPTGGGSNSGRLTATYCAAGGLCKQFLAARGIAVEAKLAEVGGVAADASPRPRPSAASPHERAMLAEIERARKDGDSVGGRVHCRVTNFPAGLGGAMFDGLESELSAGLFAIPGVKGVAFGDASADGDLPSASLGEATSSSLDRGSGRPIPTRTAGPRLRGSANNDAFRIADGAVVTATNRAGGILGGRATGMPIEFDVILKPTPTVFKPQASVDLATMTNAVCESKGRHDPCIARRAVPVVEAIAAFVLADAICADEAAHPRICLTLTGKTLEEDLAQYKSQRYFTDMVELRVDLLTAKERVRAADFPALLWKASRPGPVVPVIFTFRRKSDGGAYEGSENARVRFFKDLLSRVSSPDHSLSSRVSCLASCLYVDFEDDFRVPALEMLAREKGVTIVRSRHEFAGGPRDARALPAEGDARALPAEGGARALPAVRMVAEAEAGEIAKFAFLPQRLKDVSALFSNKSNNPLLTYFLDLLSPNNLSPSPLILAMGPQGLASRVLSSRLGAPWTYASVGGLGELGHVSPETLVRDYRFRSVSREAALYGVTGWPLKATRSPELHNAMFAASDRDALMIPFPARTAREAIGFMNAMGMRGLAVTIPHKESVLPLLDRVDAAARRVGAVNTVVREGANLVGYNTDVAGFTEAILGFLAGKGPRLRAAVLGAGGASKAVVFALKRLGAKVEVFHRRPLTDGFDLIVNATPVDPIPDYRFTGRELVYDLVYVPAETPLMARARATGCRVENGFSMLVAQAREQQRLFRRAADGEGTRA